VRLEVLARFEESVAGFAPPMFVLGMELVGCLVLQPIVATRALLVVVLPVLVQVLLVVKVLLTDLAPVVVV
jgi:hypothetical protein